MNTKTLFAGLITLAVSLVPTMASANPEYTVNNKTGSEVKALYMSPHNVEHWGGNILGKDTLSDGEGCEIIFDPNDQECAYDIKITTADGSNWVVANIDLCQYHHVTFSTQDGNVVWDGK